jgi:hypothetical protein
VRVEACRARASGASARQKNAGRWGWPGVVSQCSKALAGGRRLKKLWPPVQRWALDDSKSGISSTEAIPANTTRSSSASRGCTRWSCAVVVYGAKHLRPRSGASPPPRPECDSEQYNSVYGAKHWQWVGPLAHVRRPEIVWRTTAVSLHQIA